MTTETKKILSVDDSAVIRKIIQGSVDMLGYGFLEAEDGLKALELMEKSVDDLALVLLDWNMPNLDGLSTLKRIKGDARYKGIPVIMVTTEGESSRIQEALAVGADGYVPKPFSREDLMATMMDYIPV